MYENLKFIAGGKFISKNEWIHKTRTITSTEVIAVTEGEVHMFIGEERFSLSRGDVLRILPGERHGGFLKSSGVSFFWIHFSDCEPEGLPPRLSRPESFGRVELIARELLHYAATDSYPPECADSMTKVLLMEINNGAAVTATPKIVAEAKEWIKRNAESKIRAAEVAESLGYSEDYLSRVFKKECGVSIKSYIDSVRLWGIKRELLVGSRTLAEISDLYGFSDYKYFLKFFKYHAGISPRKYRESYFNMHTNSK